jgi:tetratricopeptide (TPR) repeat protein
MSDSILAGRSPAHTACCKYLQLASIDSALDHSENIIRLQPDKPEGYVFKAKALFKMKRFKEAEEVLLNAMKIAQQNHLIRSDVEGIHTYNIWILFMD